MFSHWSRRTKVVLSVVSAAAIVVVIVLAVVLQPREDQDDVGAIATDAAPCEQVGAQLLRAGGNAIDVTIGTLICEGVSSAQSMGLGGGFLMTIYDRKRKTSYVLNSRERAASAATRDMFGNNTDEASLYGARAIAVPMELKGYHMAYQKFGKLPWKTIVEPTIKICEEGVPVIAYVERVLREKREEILKSPSLSELLVDPGTGDVKKQGDLIFRKQLAETLRVVAEEGAYAVYNGSLADGFYKDLSDYGSIISKEDLQKFGPRWDEPTVAALPGGYKLISPPPPGSGPLLAHFLKLTASMVEPPLRTAAQWQRIVEALKFVYAARSDFGDPEFVPEALKKSAQLLNETFVNEIRDKIKDRDQGTLEDIKYYGASWAAADPKGTAHVSVITEDFAVSVTSTVNTEYGSMLVSKSTGIILNNEMDDFSLPNVNSNYGVPPSEANFIAPGKIPQSSMAPSVILDQDDNVRLVVGASGGPRIPSAAGLVTLLHLYLGMDLSEAIVMKRIHHQLAPMEARCEIGFSEEIKQGLRKLGHNTTELSTTASSVMAIAVHGNKYYPVADARREGVTATV